MGLSDGALETVACTVGELEGLSEGALDTVADSEGLSDGALDTVTASVGHKEDERHRDEEVNPLEIKSKYVNSTFF